MLSRFFPDRIFKRRLSDAADKRLRLALARAEESVVEAHVQNALLFVDALDGELPFDRAIDTYIREMAIPEPLASGVVTRALVALGDRQDAARDAAASAADDAEAPLLDDRPVLRLDPSRSSDGESRGGSGRDVPRRA